MLAVSPGAGIDPEQTVPPVRRGPRGTLTTLPPARILRASMARPSPDAR